MTLTFWQRVYAGCKSTMPALAGLAVSLLLSLLWVALSKYLHPTAPAVEQHAEKNPSGIRTSYYAGYRAGWNAAVKYPPADVITRVEQPMSCGAYHVPGCIESKPHGRKEPRIVSSGGCAGICGSIDGAWEYANKHFHPHKSKASASRHNIHLVSDDDRVVMTCDNAGSPENPGKVENCKIMPGSTLDDVATVMVKTLKDEQDRHGAGDGTINPFTPYEFCMLRWSIYSYGNVTPLGNICPAPPQPKP